MTHQKDKPAIRKRVRTISGVLPLAIITKPYPCPGQCVYCPTERDMPKSYLSNEPAVMRAIGCHFDPQRQVENRINALHCMGHATDKIELIILGGTFTAYPVSYQEEFVKECFTACNEEDVESLAQAQSRNEKAVHRIVGLSIETRPDEITEGQIKHLRNLGVTRIEIGVQSTFDDVLRLVRRGHSVSDVAYATKLLKDAGFKICYHMMLNLPGSDPQKDREMFEILFSDPRFYPDMLKIYPCLVVADAELYDWWRRGKYQPYDDATLAGLLVEIKGKIPPFVRINRVIREFPARSIVAGTKRSNMREEVQGKMRELGLACQCIRCREIRVKAFGNGRPELKIREYQASGGKEYFLSFEDKGGALYGLLRLRIPSQIFAGEAHFIPELQHAAIIREVHTYGVSLGIGAKPDRETQHRGLGQRLIRKAEEISQEWNLKKMAVISGVGARDYFRKQGYELEGTYMTKTI